MEKKITYNTLDGGPERSNIYFSQCLGCKHFNSNKRYTCIAFPNGIPDDILYEMKKHDTTHPNQEGNITFEKDD